MFTNGRALLHYYHHFIHFICLVRFHKQPPCMSECPHESHFVSKLNCQMIEKRSRAHAIRKHIIENTIFKLNANILNGRTRSTLAMAFDEDRWIGEEVLLDLFIVMPQCLQSDYRANGFSLTQCNCSTAARVFHFSRLNLDFLEKLQLQFRRYRVERTCMHTGHRTQMLLPYRIDENQEHLFSISP